MTRGTLSEVKGMGGEPLTVSFLNRKGGVGKTSSVFHLAGAFASLGRRVLLCDLDPQASLSQGCFGPEFVERLPKGATVAALFDDKYDPDPAEIIRQTGFSNVAIVPANNDLTDHNTPRPEEAGECENALRDFLAEVRDEFDVVLADCPPNLQLCSWVALCGTEFAAVPVVPEDFSSQGLIYVQQAIDLAMTRRNPKLRLLGYVLTMYNQRLGIHRAYEKLLREQYGDLVFPSVFPLSTAFKEAVARRRPVTEDKSKSVAAEATIAISREIIERAPVYRARPPEFYYAGNRYVPGVAEPCEPELLELAAGEAD
jgi:chromosome partitioning protein